MTIPLSSTYRQCNAVNGWENRENWVMAPRKLLSGLTMHTYTYRDLIQMDRRDDDILD